MCFLSKQRRATQSKEQMILLLFFFCSTHRAVRGKEIKKHMAVIYFLLETLLFFSRFFHALSIVYYRPWAGWLPSIDLLSKMFEVWMICNGHKMWWMNNWLQIQSAGFNLMCMYLSFQMHICDIWILNALTAVDNSLKGATYWTSVN